MQTCNKPHLALCCTIFSLTSTHNETTSCVAFTVSDQIVSAEVTLISFSIPCLCSLLSWLLPFIQIFSNSRYNPWTTLICFLTGPDFCSGHFIAEYLLLQENTSLFTFILSNSSTMKRVGVWSSHQLLLVNNYSICTYWVNELKSGVLISSSIISFSFANSNASFELISYLVPPFFLQCIQPANWSRGQLTNTVKDLWTHSAGPREAFHNACALPSGTMTLCLTSQV